jgi:photosystem II stability/assembly factor-like uncharacterized protein
MKRLITLLLLGSILFSCQDTTDLKISEESFTQKPHDFMFMQRAYPTGTLKTDAYRKAVQWKKNNMQRSNGGAIWEFAGPENVGGRITDIEIPIDNGSTYYIGAASGGVFKTTDGGSNWLPIFDEQEMLSIGDIEISKTDTDVIWVGTGEVNAGGGSLAYDGDGMYKSSDAGLTWESKGLPDVGSIGKVLIDPNDEDVLFVAAMGPLFRNDTNRGVYKTEDGGATWDQKLFVSDITGVIDMAMHPTNGDIVYASSWERIRRPNNRQYGGETSGLWRSLDGGDSWTEMTNGLPSAPSEKGRISIDISQSNPDVLYARYADANGSIQGVYRTDDGGDTWVTRNSNQLTNVGFHWWFRGIFVDPTDEDIIYNVDFIVEKSTDGGNNWSTAFPGVHVDQHALAFNAMVPGGVLLGNDGGLYYSVNDGASSNKDLTLPITQFYRFHVDAQNEDKVYGGAQDNNTIRTTTGSVDDWTPIYGGDGFQPLVDPTNTNVIYCLSQNGNLGKSTNDGSSFSNATNGISNGDRKNWNTPIAFDPANPDIVYYGANKLYQTTNAAGNWSAISPDLTDGPYAGNLTLGTITSISVSSFDSDLIYVGTDDGNVWVTEDGGGNWENISSTLPDRWVTSVLASRDSASKVYVTFSGYRYGEDNGHVYRSNNTGGDWTDISTTLPDIPINDIVQDSQGYLYLGADVGVFASVNEGADWQVLGDNLPSLVVNDMHIHEASQYLYIGTYGRSSYKIDLSAIVLGAAENTFANEVVLAPNPAATYVDIKSSNGLGSVTVFDVLGREVKFEKIETSDQQVRMDLSELSRGVYYVLVSNGSSKTTQKLIKK